MASSSGSATAEYTAVRVKNFDANTTDTETLQNIFASCGTVKSAILVKGQGGQSGAACYIHFEEHESAKAAVEQMNGAEVSEARIEVEPAHDTPSSSGAVDKGSARSCSIFVKGFGPEVGTEELKEAFRDAGEIVSAVVMRDQAGASRGFGFVNFAHPEGADRAVAEHGSMPQGQGSWLVRKALPKTPKQDAVGDDPCTLYVRGLEADVDWDTLATMFQAFGLLVSCRILTDPKTGISRCAGLLRFETPEQAMHAMKDMHGRQVGERRLHVTIAQNGPRFQKSTPRDFEQPRPPPRLPGMLGMYPSAFPPGMSGRFLAAMTGPVMLPASPEQAQLLAAQQRYMHPAYAMYNPGMMFMGPQGYPQPMWPQGYFTGSPYPGSPLNEYGSLQQYQQQQVLPGMSRQQQAQQYYMMTSGQDGTYFDVASNTFMDGGRGYRGVPIPAPPRRSRRGGRNGSRKSLGTPGQSDSGGTSGPLQEAAERTSSAEGSLSQAGQPTMPRRGARSLSAGQLDGLMGQLAVMSDDKSRKDFLGGHVFALLEVDHSEGLAGEITSQLLALSEGDILHMLRVKDALDAQVARVLSDMRPSAGANASGSEPRGGSACARAAQDAQHSHEGPDARAFSGLSLK